MPPPKQLHFLSGLPRSGSTVLAAVLNQHPSLYVTPTSGLIDLMGGTVAVWENNPSLAAQGSTKDELFRLLRSTAFAKYEHIEKPIIIDKSRGWADPQIMTTMAAVMGAAPKIIATVRNIPDCAASFVRVARPENVEDFLRSSQLMEHLKGSYVTLSEGYKATPENFCIIDYDDLMDNPQKELARIHAFLGLKDFTYDLNAIEGGAVKERDAEVWKIPGLHDIKPRLERQHAEKSKDVLGDLYDSFCQPAFWKGKYATTREIQLIDLELAASTMGDFEKGWEIAQQLERDKPRDNRAAYNRGWYMLNQGKLQEGQKLLDRGRIEGVFGNRKPETPAPIWDGRTPGTVLLNLEGGLGDQMHEVRFAKDIAARGCRVIVACSGQLAGLFESCEGVSAVVQHSALYGVYHDFWVPAMSAVIPLGFEYKNISGKPYIKRPTVEPSARKRIGLRWHGNPRFEHEQHRVFPPDLLFNAVKEYDADFISLQRDVATEARPSWVREVPLAHWGETRDAIASCDLVISSCTSVAHLSGAIGVPTWIVSPILPYYLWALSGPKTPWYDSVRLFRQSAFGEWSSVFNEIKLRLDSGSEHLF